mmetsp:Transcript_69378/g.224324  ORF Transcript_69378/g.224324 Transcript_69378/m.224324 type:complete len:223 (-) Transcript_69378:93-761(-)
MPTGLAEGRGTRPRAMRAPRAMPAAETNRQWAPALQRPPPAPALVDGRAPAPCRAPRAQATRGAPAHRVQPSPPSTCRQPAARPVPRARAGQPVQWPAIPGPRPPQLPHRRRLRPRRSARPAPPPRTRRRRGPPARPTPRQPGSSPRGGRRPAALPRPAAPPRPVAQARPTPVPASLRRPRLASSRRLRRCRRRAWPRRTSGCDRGARVQSACHRKEAASRV